MTSSNDKSSSPHNYLAIGESKALVELFTTLFEVPTELSSKSEYEEFSKRVQMLDEFGCEFLMGLSETYSTHINSVLLKDHIMKILSMLTQKLVKYEEERKHVATLLIHFLKFLQRLMVANPGLYESVTYPLDILKINQLKSLKDGINDMKCIKSKPINLNQSNLVIRAQFKLSNTPPKPRSELPTPSNLQVITGIKVSECTFFLIINRFTEGKYTNSQTKHEMLKHGNYRFILITMGKDKYNNWVNVECDIKDKDHCTVEYLNVERDAMEAKTDPMSDIIVEKLEHPSVKEKSKNSFFEINYKNEKGTSIDLVP